MRVISESVIISMDSVEVHGFTMHRPNSISRSQWLRDWEQIKDGLPLQESNTYTTPIAEDC